MASPSHFSFCSSPLLSLSLSLSPPSESSSDFPLTCSSWSLSLAVTRNLSHREEARLEQTAAKDKYDGCKNFAFLFIGVLTLVYTLVELGMGVWFHILVMLSDGFHNLSDVVALGIGLWASKKSRQAKSMQYSYGFARTELLGALVNGCFLLSLALYVMLEAIPKFIRPEMPEEGISFYFIIGAGVGLGLNVTGAIVFFITGRGHSHAGHSHEHGGGGHEEKAPKKKKVDKKKNKKRGGRDENANRKELIPVSDDKWSETEPLLLTDDDEGAAHSHDHEHGSKHETAHDHDHGHGHSDASKGKQELDSGHSHAHGGHDESEEGEHAGHSHGGHDAGNAHADHNLHAIFLHFLGDALSSVFVLVTALLWYFFPMDSAACPVWSIKCHNSWVAFIDPATSLIVVIIILTTTIPLVKSVLSILLQKVPKGIDSDRISQDLAQLEDVAGVHDLHIWELVSGLNLASVHLDCRGNGANFNDTLTLVRKVFHENKVHSVTVQPEFVGDDHPGRNHCDTMCVDDCVETWCCEPEIEPELQNAILLDGGL